MKINLTMHNHSCYQVNRMLKRAQTRLADVRRLAGHKEAKQSMSTQNRTFMVGVDMDGLASLCPASLRTSASLVCAASASL